MALRGPSAFRCPLDRRAGLLPRRWGEAPLFVSVTVVVAACVAIAGSHLRQPDQGAASPHPSRVRGFDGLPDVMSNRCLEQSARRLQQNPFAGFFNDAGGRNRQ